MQYTKEIISEHLYLIDKSINMKYITNKSLIEWFQPFIDTITDEFQVPYLLNTSERFRASPLSSTIIGLNSANLLPDNALDIMYKNLIFLKDNNISSDQSTKETRKASEDKEGWSLGEGVSVWSTSLAIIALLSNEKKDPNITYAYKNSVIWLANQRSSGYAYQNHTNCDKNSIMTAHASYALSLSLKNKQIFKFNRNEEQTIINAITDSFTYLKQNIIKKKYWVFNNKPNSYATIWSLISIKEMISCEQIQTETIETIETFYKDVYDKCVNYVLASMPREIKCWDSEQIVKEAGAKYAKQKNYHSFSPTLILQLMDLGVSAYHPKIINQICWLIDNEGKWKIREYDKDNMCTFTYAMVLSAIVKWVNAVGKENARELINNRTSRTRKLTTLFFGYPYMKSRPQVMLYKNKMISYIILLLIISLLCILRGYIINLFKWILNLVLTNGDTILINVISSGVYYFLGLLLTVMVSYFLRRGK
ncbi:MAG: hypothetical protein IJH37_08445 [Clostridia bacterium]|nr:hypothetical protein [Clostridia bacterium]